jgi:hypothetical protein
MKSVKTSLGGIEAHHSVYEVEGGVISATYTVIGNTSYSLIFEIKLSYYDKYTSIIDIMRNSFQFLETPKKDNIIVQPRRNQSTISGFMEYVSHEYHLKMDYPSNWLELCAPIADVHVMFRPLDATVYPNTPDSLLLYVLENDSNVRNIKDYAKIQKKEFKNSNVKLLKESNTKLGGLSAYQIIYETNGNKFLTISTYKNNKVFKITYIARIDTYEKEIRNVRQVIDSFDFLDVT